MFAEHIYYLPWRSFRRCSAMWFAEFQVPVAAAADSAALTDLAVVDSSNSVASGRARGWAAVFAEPVRAFATQTRRSIAVRLRRHSDQARDSRAVVARA